MKIIPAILPKNFSEIEDKVSLIKGVSKTVQIDICDGSFVPSITWPYIKHDKNFEAILREDRGMPEWESFDYEFDLMIKNPSEDDARKWLSAGSSRIILHIESSDNLDQIISILSGLVEIGIAINLSTKSEEMKKYADKIQFIQIMGIKKIGFQGQKFEPDTLDKIREMKMLFPDLPIQIDGGITLENASLLKHNGVDSIVVGSSLFESDNIIHTFDQFKRI